MRRLLLLLLLCAAPAAAEPARSGRSMVATASPHATEAALAVLRQGGGAVDAAVAAQAALSVVEPHASGLFGGALLLSWRREAGLHFYDGIASAPAASADRLTAGGVGVATVARSGRAVAVPGAIAMLALAHRDHGRLPWASLFAPAISMAEDGVALPAYLHQVLRTRATQLRAVPAIRALYFDADGEPLAAGAKLRNPDQAAALRRLAAEGPAAIHGGALGEAAVEAAAAHPVPGWLTMEDLRAYRAAQRGAACLEVLAHLVCSAAPPASGGIAVLQTLAIAERLGIAHATPRGAAATHLFLEASRLATADRRRWIGDPDVVTVPQAALLDAAYLDERAGLAEAGRAMPQVAPGTPPARHGAIPAESDPFGESATTHVAIVDSRGDAVAFTTTNNLNFGAELLAGGVTLNNGMTNFATNPGPPEAPAQNRMQPGKRPATTMAPTIVLDADGLPVIVLGAGGGARIPDAVAAAIIEILAHAGDAEAATARPRIGAQGGVVEIERGSDAEALLPALTALGHRPRVVPVNTGLQVIRRLADGRLEGAADPRRDGIAAGE